MTYADGNVTGNDFNQIVDSLKRRNRGGVLGQVMSWMKTVSSPTGGGIRHGMDLKGALNSAPQSSGSRSGVDA
ncbi:hypothetical protein ACKZDW_04510 (plasmid) [Ralstonia syzygii subsp. celebesensis]|uniref:hypothetical protein n=1 Tax=Ralstonia syzygii TaxID=28097 RepID=UPI00387E11D1